MKEEPVQENLNKSEISQVFEIALKRNLPVNFEVCHDPIMHRLQICKKYFHAHYNLAKSCM